MVEQRRQQKLLCLLPVVVVSGCKENAFVPRAYSIDIAEVSDLSLSKLQRGVSCAYSLVFVVRHG
jgi:hypothetical protein